MSLARPILRNARRVDFDAQLDQTVFAAGGFYAWDAADISVWRKNAGQVAFHRVLDGFTVAVGATGAPTVTFALPPRYASDDPSTSAAVAIRVESRRVDERPDDVTRASAIMSAAIEHRHDVIATVQQELRRDIDEASDDAAAAYEATTSFEARLAAAEAHDLGQDARLGALELSAKTGATWTAPLTLTGSTLINTTLQGVATAPTQPAADNSTKLATTQYVDRGLSAALPKQSYARLLDLPAVADNYAIKYIQWGEYQQFLALKSPELGWRPMQSPLINGANQYGQYCFGIPYLLAGGDIQYLNAESLIAQPLSWSASTPHRLFGFDASITLTPTRTVGLNGCDVNYANAAAGAIVMTAGWYYLYMLGDPASPFNNTKFVFSKSISLTTVRQNLNANVPAAAAWSYIRKLPFAVYWNGTAFLPYRMSGGWPYPCISYVGFSMNGGWAVINGATYTTETLVYLGNFIPDNGRLAEIAVRVVSGGTAGDVTIRTEGVPGPGLVIPVPATAGAAVAVPYAKIQTSSNRQLYVQTPPGAQLTLYVQGFWMSEQS